LVGVYTGLQVLWATSTVLATANQLSNNKAARGDPAKTVDSQPAAPIVRNNAKHDDDHGNSTGQDVQAVVPAAATAPVTAKTPARANDAKPKSMAPLYARIRQIVLENKTEETQRLGMGEVAYQNVPDDGSIMVGMEVSYAPFFNHQVIKSVRPIYQRPD